MEIINNLSLQQGESHSYAISGPDPEGQKSVAGIGILVRVGQYV